MRGLDPDERAALLGATWGVDLSIELSVRMLRRGLIEYSSAEGIDHIYRVSSQGHLALRLDTMARGAVSV